MKNQEVYNWICEAKDILWEVRDKKAMLRKPIYNCVLRDLKRRLKNFNMQTGEWKNEDN